MPIKMVALTLLIGLCDVSAFPWEATDLCAYH